MIEAPGARHEILHRDPHAYSAHPHAVRLEGGEWLVVFNKTVRRPLILHPPQDPEFRNWLMRSSDGGRSWSAPEVVPGYGWSGVECAGLTDLGGGRVMLNQWRFVWHPLAAARRRADRASLRFPAELLQALALSPELETDRAALEAPEGIAPWARGGGEAVAHLSDDGGASWRESWRIDTAPFSGGYGMRGAVRLSGGALLLPLSDIPHYRQVFVVRSEDGGRSWGRPALAAALPGSEFEEPALLELPGGRLLMLLRDNGRRRLHRVWSDDAGRSWTAPEALPIEGYPPHLLALPDGRILCTYGWRRPDYGIRAVLSADGGQSWDMERAIRIRGGLPNTDLGYPSTVLAEDSSLFTVYYGQDPDGVTCIQATRWRL
ncbi:MAG TPA: sialidase family protein [Dongiaceae bacterium]|nr:sialidase family protein [Dongiaceae bacterium]